MEMADVTERVDADADHREPGNDVRCAEKHMTVLRSRVSGQQT